jgi:hypothetical protein
LPEDVTLLRFNKENNQNEAAQLKIIMTHFSGPNIKMQPFIEMDLSVKPHAFHSHFFKAQRLLLEKCIYYQRSIVNKYPVPFHACRRRHRRR